MKYKINEKDINIPDKDISHLMETMKLQNKEEAIKIWLEDEGYLHNEEQEELCRKAKANRITATIHKAREKAPSKRTTAPRVKENPTKEKIINAAAIMLEQLGAININIENVSKLITFTIDNNNFKLDLVQKREKKQ